MNLLRYYFVPFVALLIWVSGMDQIFAQQSDWELVITGEDNEDNSLNVIIGASESATEDFDPGLDQYAPPPAPNGSFDLRIVDGNEDYFKKIRPLTETTSTWSISTRPEDDETSVTLSWNSGSLENTDGQFHLEYADGSGEDQLNMKTSNSIELQPGQQTVTVTHVIQEEVTVSYEEGWQLIGFPAQAQGVDPYSIFTNAIPGTFFTHQGSYSEPESLSAGIGFWIRLSEEETVNIEPPFFTSTSLSFEPGWYIISGPGVSMPFSSLANPDSGFVEGSLKGYNDGYVDVDTLEPGKGYWVLSEGTFTINLESDAPVQTKQNVNQLATPDGFSQFSISNEGKEPMNFFLGESLEGQPVNPLSFSMPPVPPNEAFDVRFSNDSRIATQNSGTLLVQSPGDSMRIRYMDSDTEETLVFEILREDEDENQQVMLAPGEEQSISGIGITEMNVSSNIVSSNEEESETPRRLELSQNYPNPFNPVTMIAYSLPKDSEVSIEVFDMTGRRVAVLRENYQTAGNHTVEFDASDLSSGVYMYRLKSAGSMLTRKMTLIK